MPSMSCAQWPIAVSIPPLRMVAPYVVSFVHYLRMAAKPQGEAIPGCVVFVVADGQQTDQYGTALNGRRAI